jgi:hypothetical protein
MANNALAIFEGGALPAHVMDANATANIVPRAGVNSLSIEGKVFTINMDGKKTKLLRKDEDGEEQPVQIFTGIILDYTKKRGREYYKGAYDPKVISIPDCWSEDGVKPEDDVPVKMSATCAACPMAKKNSVVKDDGKGAVACGQFRKIALIPAAQIGAFPPLRLKIKITSDYDKTGAEKNAATGWYAFQQYLDLLVSKNVLHTSTLPTKIKFDTSVAYPKLLFSPGKSWVPADVWSETIKPLAASDEVAALLADSYHPTTETTGTKPLPAEDEEEEGVTVAAAPKPAAAKPKAKAKAAAPVAEPQDEDEEEAITIEGTAVEIDADAEPTAEEIAEARRAKKADADAALAAANVAKAAAKAAATKAAATVADPEDDEEVVVAPPKTPKAPAAPVAAPAKPKAAAAATPKATPAKAAINAPPDVAGMLDEWDD